MALNDFMWLSLQSVEKNIGHLRAFAQGHKITHKLITA